ncbi:MAG TPA: DoxX family protein [Terracidiphilus sp.]|jgi:uncharacterized membrane protein YphA (DoxX/SURF4 family)
MRRNVPLLLVRLIVGIVFLTEGILKFLQPEELGAGRFARIGLPAAHVLGPTVGFVEIISGAAVILNLYTGEAAVLLLCVIVTALVTTKVPILLGHSVWHFGVAKSAAHTGVLGFVHEARTDLAMLFCLVALVTDSGVRFGRPRPWWQRR